MNEDVNKFRAATKEIINNLETLCCVLEAKCSCTEDAVGRLKEAFDTLRAEAGSKRVKDL